MLQRLHRRMSRYYPAPRSAAHERPSRTCPPSGMAEPRMILHYHIRSLLPASLCLWVIWAGGNSTGGIPADLQHWSLYDKRHELGLQEHAGLRLLPGAA